MFQFHFDDHPIPYAIITFNSYRREKEQSGRQFTLLMLRSTSCCPSPNVLYFMLYKNYKIPISPSFLEEIYHHSEC